MKLALLQYQVGRYATVAAWHAALDARVGEAADRGAELLVLPEYATLDAIPAPLPSVTSELQAAVSQYQAVLDALRAVAAKHNIWLLGGSMLAPRHDGRVVNRAPLVTPAGRVVFQDKHRTTRFEWAQWNLAAGAQPAVFGTPWGRIGISVCYDIEHPALARAQVEEGAWLILVPVDTDSAAGFNRVCVAARACAMSNQCYVALCTTVGDAPWIASLDTNHGYAAVFGPIDHGFPDDGVIARTAMDEPGWLYADLQEADLLAARHDGAVLNHRDYAPPPHDCPVIDACR